MKISYEMNPPKIVRNASFVLEAVRKDLDRFHRRISELKTLADSIHLTDSVLGVPRISGVSAARDVRNMHSPVKMRCSIRVRDRNLSSIIQLTSDAVMSGVDGLLVVKGDKPPGGHSADSGLKSSMVVRTLREQGFGSKINLYLSIPCNPNSASLRQKLDAEPHGFITQSIGSLDQLQEIVDKIKSHSSRMRVLPCIMIPSPKNARSAKMIGLDWSGYAADAGSFIKRAHDICGEVLMSSPNSFGEGISMLRTLKEGDV